MKAETTAEETLKAPDPSWTVALRESITAGLRYGALGTALCFISTPKSVNASPQSETRGNVDFVCVSERVDTTCEEIARLTREIRRRSIDARSPELLRLAEEAIASVEAHKDENIDEWAERLIDDVADEND